MGRILRGLAGEGHLRVVAAETSDVAEEARRRHGLSPTATAALGRAMTGALLLAQLLLKTPKERITLRLEGTGPLGGLLAEADPQGNVRGYVQNPQAEVPLRPDGKLNVGELVGAGVLRVDRSLPNGEIYSSTVPLVSGEIAEDLASYLVISHQIPSVVALGVMVSPTGRVVAAGGLIVQVLPGADDRVISYLEERARVLPAVTSMISRGRTPEEMVRVALGDLAARVVERGVVRFRCRCSRARVRHVLASLAPDDLRDLVAERGHVEVRCHFCGARYLFDEDDVEDLIRLRPGAPPRAGADLPDRRAAE